MPVTERGSGSLWVLSATCLLGLVIAVSLAVAQSVVARHRARGVAEMAALAAAQARGRGVDVACRAGERVAAASGARLRTCVLTRAGSEVVVAVPLPGPLARLGPSIATGGVGSVPP